VYFAFWQSSLQFLLILSASGLAYYVPFALLGHLSLSFFSNLSFAARRLFGDGVAVARARRHFAQNHTF
jgi:hypothetical protein